MLKRVIADGDIFAFPSRYRPDLPLVLDGLSLGIRPGEKIGVVGRTGSGKSTVALSLFRLIELATGSIHIDGVDTRAIGVEDLRKNLAIIPQDPVLFSATVRYNLDPFGERSDAELWSALDSANLKPAITALGGLDANVSEGNGFEIIMIRTITCHHH